MIFFKFRFHHFFCCSGKNVVFPGWEQRRRPKRVKEESLVGKGARGVGVGHGCEEVGVKVEEKSREGGHRRI